jgi:hypothetical protein
MNIEDCEIGMKVECKTNEFTSIEKGEVVTISKIYYYDNHKGLKFKEKLFHKFYPEDFEPVNKFKVGDEVLYKHYYLGKFKAEIWAITKPDRNGRTIAITWELEGETLHSIVSKDNLLPLKKKDELEKGDKFIDDMEEEVEVLAVEYCDFYDNKVYFGKKENGFVSCWSDFEVEEVIYD